MLDAILVGAATGLVVGPVLAHFEFYVVSSMLILLGAGMLAGILV